MLNMNVIGRLVRDAESKSESILSFTVAVNFYDAIKKEQDVSFIKCFLNKSSSVQLHKFLTKGSQFFINLTPIQMSTYNNKPSIMARVNLINFSSSKNVETNLGKLAGADAEKAKEEDEALSKLGF